MIHNLVQFNNEGSIKVGGPKIKKWTVMTLDYWGRTVKRTAMIEFGRSFRMKKLSWTAF